MAKIYIPSVDEQFTGSFETKVLVFRLHLIGSWLV